MPAPVGNKDGDLQALIIDSWFDEYLGVVSLVRIKHGCLQKGDKIFIKSTKSQHTVDKVGIFTPKRTDTGILKAGEVGFITASIKNIYGAPVGDTITHAKTPEVESLAGFQKIKPQVYASVPTNIHYENFRTALSKLTLNDASLFYEPENSAALGHGFRCGFRYAVYGNYPERLSVNMTLI